MYLRLNCVYMSLPRFALSMNNLTTVHRQIKTLNVLNLVLRSSTTSNASTQPPHPPQPPQPLRPPQPLQPPQQKRGTDLIHLRANSSESLLLLSNNIQTDRLVEHSCIQAGGNTSGIFSLVLEELFSEELFLVLASC